MNRNLLVSAALLLALAAAGCGGNKAEDSGAAAPPPASAPGAVTVPADLDNGPRAGESPVDEALAGLGEGLFKTKGCTACHAFGTRLSGPDLNGVAMRRTARWMEWQILHPDLMIKQDPISKSLFATYALQMAKQGLTPDQARSVIEFLKKKTKEAGK
ncbi:MAG: cytochrome c [Candidatus Eisenbacteria bacterium]|nr:cytochrome c [Candidatus Eisenbacteria bacterium]